MRTDTEPPPTPPDLHAHGLLLTPYRETPDAQALFDITPDGTLRYFPARPIPWNLEGFTAFMRDLHRKAHGLTFTVRDASTRAPLGSTSFYEADGPNRAAEIGATWYAPHLQGTRINPACKLLMLSFAFDGGLGALLGWNVHPCQRVQLKCDARNTRSQRAIEKLGAVREGVLRRHRVCSDGFARDTVVYSILAEEWPAVRANLERRAAASP